MSTKSVKSQHPSNLGRYYLVSYNFLQILGWCYILYKWVHYHTVSTTDQSLWETIKLPLLLFQNAALLEVIHAIIKIVPSSPVITMLQVTSRVVVCGILIVIPTGYSTSSVGLQMLTPAWSFAEIIRYSYYFTNLIGYVPYIVTWFRYTGFIILYPIGVTGELLCFYANINYAAAYPEVLSYILPNKWNFTFSYLYFLLFFVLCYVPFFPYLYLYMFSQRRKVLGSNSSTKKTQ
ncbi:hypothetical protein KM043_018180 [Ampulex compressa]|nr:hypothetical protein KM043_018180 [Ampulex compressa]